MRPHVYCCTGQRELTRGGARTALELVGAHTRAAADTALFYGPAAGIVEGGVNVLRLYMVPVHIVKPPS